jgi:hypothetical protein
MELAGHNEAAMSFETAIRADPRFPMDRNGPRRADLAPGWAIGHRATRSDVTGNRRPHSTCGRGGEPELQAAFPSSFMRLWRLDQRRARGAENDDSSMGRGEQVRIPDIDISQSH